MTRNVDQFAAVDIEEMVVVGRVRVEIGTARLYDDFTQQPCVSELVESVIDRRQRYFDVSRHCVAVELLGGDMSVRPIHEQPCERQALLRWPEVCSFK